MKDSELDQLLRSLNASALLPASFEHNVWSRIGALESDRGLLRLNLERFFGFFERPFVAAAACAAMLMAGVWLGLNWQASSSSADMAYIQSISPFARNHQ